MDKFEAYIPTAARLLLSALFILGGLGKLADVPGFAGYLAMGGQIVDATLVAAQAAQRPRREGCDQGWQDSRRGLA